MRAREVGVQALERLNLFHVTCCERRLALTPALCRWENRSRSLDKSDERVCRTVLGKKKDACLLFPLPAGEGKGEGERPKLRTPLATAFLKMRWLVLVENNLKVELQRVELSEQKTLP
jgi:hypothetical protein